MLSLSPSVVLKSKNGMILLPKYVATLNLKSQRTLTPVKGIHLCLSHNAYLSEETYLNHHVCNLRTVLSDERKDN